MKKSRIFAAVVYFIFTFGIGLIFALTLPGYFATFTVSAEVLADALARNDFLIGLVLTEPTGFYRKPALECSFEDGGGVVLYEAVMEVYDRDSAMDSRNAKDGLVHGMLYKCYEGFLYGVQGKYDVFSQGNNGTLLKVTTESGSEKEIPLLDYDANGDGKNDGISTFTQNGFVVLEIREQDVSSVKRIEFTDSTGKTVYSAEADTPLTFESGFFDRFGDIGAYNALVASGNVPDLPADQSASINEQRNAYVDSVIAALGEDPDCAATAGSEEYAAASREVNRRANNKAIPFVILYFVAIYIIADFLLGSHFIIRFFKWFLFKVCKIPHKEKRRAEEEVFGHDYYSTVTLKLDLTEVPEFSGSVEIRYTGSGGSEFAFLLLKEGGYSATARMKAGVYVNPFIDIDRAYGPADMPENLEVEGYQMEKTIKIVKREV